MDVVVLPVELIHKLIDVLNDEGTEESIEVMDELTRYAEGQGVPVWFDNDHNPIWTTKPKTAEGEKS